jgi:hypothetical protein
MSSITPSGNPFSPSSAAPQSQSSPAPPPNNQPEGGAPTPSPSGSADGTTLSPDAGQQEPPASSRRSGLLDALKSNFGGNDHLRDNSAQLAGLTDNQLETVQKRREMDKAITRHEEDHHRVAGDLARSGCVYETESGEDGQQYRKAGHVMIDMSEENDPKKTAAKMKQVREAAMAPEGNVLAPLSEQDKKVAREATEKEKRAEDMLAGKPVKPAQSSDRNSSC